MAISKISGTIVTAARKFRNTDLLPVSKINNVELGLPSWQFTITTASANHVFRVFTTGMTSKLIISWGDGNAETSTTVGTIEHTYATAGTYKLRIAGVMTGTIPRIMFYGTDQTTNSVLKSVDAPLQGVSGVKSFQSMFRGCTGLTSILADTFRYYPAATSFRETFDGCTGITGGIPADLFRYQGTSLTSAAFYQTFENCSGITGDIPTDLFRYNTQVSSNAFYGTFQGCSNITGIPDDLFRYNTLVSSSGFLQTFDGCSKITSIPNDLFRYNTLVGSNGFMSTFAGTGITSIPVDLFRYNINVSSGGFVRAFQNCTKLASLPDDLFRYNISVTSFHSVFSGCTVLASYGADLFRYNTLATNFTGAFQNCNKMQERADTFFISGGESTRFLDQSVNFTNCFKIGVTYTGTPGTAPALWDCDFGSGTPTKTECWFGHYSTLSLSNINDIPIDWK